MLQRSVGNAAVTAMVIGRGASPRSGAVAIGAPPTPSVERDATEPAPSAELDVQRAPAGTSFAPPVPPSAPNPKADPRFAAVAGATKSAGQQLKKHAPASQEVGRAQAAAKGPGDDKASQAKAVQVDKMAAAKPGGFDKAAFIAAVKKAIAAAAPKNLDEADKFATSGKADGVKGEVMSKVSQGKETSAKSVKDEATKAPDPSVGKDKPVTPLSPEPTPAQPAVNGAAGMPGPAPAEQVNFAGGPAEVDAKMKDAEVTEEHLKKSNEPQLQSAAAAKKDAEMQSAAAPKAVRQNESQALQEARTGAGADATKAAGAMTKDKTAALGRIAGAKTDTKSKDEVERAKISADINRIFDSTKSETEAILNGLDGLVTAEFDKGEAQARSEFTAKHKADMERYKDKRYSGAAGWIRWGEDLFAGLPAEANKIYDDAKALYESKMTVVISNVADLIGRELDRAKARIAKGRQEIKTYINSKPANLQKIAADAGKDMSSKFDQLESDVDSKQQSLVDGLANKYVEARGKVDEEIKAEQESNKGFVAKAKDAVMGAIDTILKLKALFMGLLAKAASAFTKILDDPVKFISNFMSAIKQGFMSFAGNILTHLKKGLLGWLFGALAGAGIELPDSFDFKGILKLIGSILGLTWTNIKARIVKTAPWVGKVIDVIESKIEIFTILATQGIGGLWNWIKKQLNNLTELIITPIKEFVIEKVVTAGISWVLGMLSPAGALVKIVQALIGVVQWIMERGAALMDFVGTVIDAVSDIANGGVGAVPAKIEAALGKAVPLVIAFLANLLGLGGISDKIKSILKAVQAPINKALDFVIKGALKLAGPLVKGIKGIGAKVKAKIATGKAWVKGKVEAGKQWVRDKVSGRKKVVPGQTQTPRQMAAAAVAAAKDGYRALSRGVSPAAASAALRSVLGRHRAYGVKSLELENGSNGLRVKASVNPTRVWQNGMWVTISPIVIQSISKDDVGQAGGMTSKEMLASKSKVTASGHFLCNGRGYAIGAMTSSSRARYRRDATRSAQGAHAEEQVTNAFEEIYNEVLGQRRNKESGAPQAFDIEMGIDVSVSSCPNCARHIANFVRRIRSDGCSVRARMKFGALYHGPNSAFSPDGRVVMPKATADERVLRDKFFENGTIKAAKGGRVWGSLGLAMKPPSPPRAFESMPSGPKVGKYGLAILRAAQVGVEVLETDEKNLSPEQKGNLADKRGKLRSALEEVDKMLAPVKVT